MDLLQKSVLPFQGDGIVLSGVSKSFDGSPVLSDFSLTVAPRGVTALMGTSGSGKTTVCSLLLGLTRPDAGEIVNPARQVSAAFQDPRLIPWLTAEDNVAFVLHGVPKEEKRARAREMLTLLGLTDAYGKYPAELSGGMQQRVSLARAFLAPHDFLILDEPFRGLDDENRATVLGMIAELAQDSPVLLVTHDRSDVEALGAKAIRLD